MVGTAGEADEALRATPDLRPEQPRTTGRPVRFAYMPALDGWRAIAVVGVMLFHGGAPGAEGGFLGVNIFFVLSGFLITSLLIGEWVRDATIRLARFWARRARRLLPALLLMLVAVAVYLRVRPAGFDPSSLRGDELSTLFYVANWHQIISGGSYFAQAAQPSPLEHTWSLAIEEQFYLVWPPVVLVLLALGRRLRPARQLWPVLGAAVAGAVGSAVLMRVLYLQVSPVDRLGEVTRLYEGTDTRSQDILVGASLAVVLALWARHRTPLPPATARGGSGPSPVSDETLRDRSPHRWSRPVVSPVEAWEVASRTRRLVIQAAGWAALATILVVWNRATGTSPFLLEGGYFLFALAVALVIVSIVTAQGAPLATALGNPVFRYLGRISYGIYLWHLPLFLILDAATLHLAGLPLLAVRMTASVGMATLSYVLVEEPIRRWSMPSRSDLATLAGTAVALVVAAALVVGLTVPPAVTAVRRGTIPVPAGPEYQGPPVRINWMGDSQAWTAWWSIATTDANRPYDTVMTSASVIGCGLMSVTDDITHGVVSQPNSECDRSSPAAEQLPAVWTRQVHAARPDVTFLLAGRWEESNVVIDGQVQHIGQPRFDSLLRSDLERAVAIGTSTGGYMVLATAPCDSTGEQPNGQPWPEDSAIRRLDYDHLLAQVAARDPARVQVFDFGSEVCPGGTFRTTADGITIRTPDGVHFPYQAGDDRASGRWLAWKILPDLVRVGRLQMEGRPLNGSPAS